MDPINTVRFFPIYELQDDEIKSVETKLKSKKFLLENQHLRETCTDDDGALKSLDVTHQQIADKIEELVCKAKPILSKMQQQDTYDGPFQRNRLKPIVDNRFQLTIDEYYQQQKCPFSFSHSSVIAEDLDCPLILEGAKITILNLETSESIHFSYLTCHMIRQHGFFQKGKEHFDPVTACRVLELMQKQKGATKPA